MAIPLMPPGLHSCSILSYSSSAFFFHHFSAGTFKRLLNANNGRQRKNIVSCAEESNDRGAQRGGCIRNYIGNCTSSAFQGRRITSSIALVERTAQLGLQAVPQAACKSHPDKSPARIVSSSFKINPIGRCLLCYFNFFFKSITSINFNFKSIPFRRNNVASILDLIVDLLIY